MSTELHDLSLAELSDLIAARKLSPAELVDALIRRVEELDAQTRAFITPAFDLARRTFPGRGKERPTPWTWCGARAATTTFTTSPRTSSAFLRPTTKEIP